MGELKEKCAVVGIVNKGEIPTAEMGYESLLALQHRGEEASGMALVDYNGSLQVHRGNGLVKDVYSPKQLRQLEGESLIGHNRYSTSGSRDLHQQPYVDELTGLAFAHNGNLPVTHYLEQYLESHNAKTLKLNDSEMMGAAIANYIREGQDLPDAVELAYSLFRGSFSCVALHEGTLVAFRDAYGIRPLAMGYDDDGSTFISSETCGLEIIDATFEREIGQGELLIVNGNNKESRQVAEADPKLDIFEFVYFARHDSQLYGESVNEVRRRFGEKLATEHPPRYGNPETIIVLPVPDTSIPAGEGYAEALNLRNRQAVIKNRFVGRTFMKPGHENRQRHLRRKHNIIPEVVDGKDVILIDDSIVRLNTMPRLVALTKSLGAKTVSVLIASPPVRFPDHYGIDTPDQSELAAAHMTIEEMREKIDCKYLGYLSLSGMIEATHKSADMFNLACFNGEYPINIGDLKNKIQTPISMEFAD